MRTGCQPPFCHGTGGFCGCNCKCCPPPCCPVIAVYFNCGAPKGPLSPAGCPPSALGLWQDLPLNVAKPSEGLPGFNPDPILSADNAFTLGLGSIPCSVPCHTVCVELKCGGFNMPCCCLELLNGKIFSVGNGYVNAPTTIPVPGCGTATVLINGSPPPVFVLDCEVINVTLELHNIDPFCCICSLHPIDIQCAPCTTKKAMTPLFRRKIDPRTGKTKINPNTGKPIIAIDKRELLKRVRQRIEQSKRRGKN